MKIKNIFIFFLLIKFIEKIINDGYKYQNKNNILLPLSKIFFFGTIKNLPIINKILGK